MAKYSYESKKEVVEEYLCGKTGYQALVMKYQIKKPVLRLWISNYKNYGDKGLMYSRSNRTYSVECKLEATTRYEVNECSYRQLTLELGSTNSSMIVDWRRQYRREGIEGLLPHKRGRPVTKRNNHNQPLKAIKKNESIDASTREASENRIKELGAENRGLIIQKMFWERLRSLGKEKAMNKRRRLSPNSEDNSN